jgi:hypothetical protein
MLAYDRQGRGDSTDTQPYAVAVKSRTMHEPPYNDDDAAHQA